MQVSCRFLLMAWFLHLFFSYEPKQTTATNINVLLTQGSSPNVKFIQSCVRYMSDSIDVFPHVCQNSSQHHAKSMSVSLSRVPSSVYSYGPLQVSCRCLPVYIPLDLYVYILLGGLISFKGVFWNDFYTQTNNPNQQLTFFFRRMKRKDIARRNTKYKAVRQQSFNQGSTYLLILRLGALLIDPTDRGKAG